MSESFRLTKQQIRILKLIRKKTRTCEYLAHKLHTSIEDVRQLTRGKMSDYLNVKLPSDSSLGYGPSELSIKHDGLAYIEELIDQEHHRRMEIRHFWIGILFGGILGWLLTAFGTPNDLIQAIRGLIQ